jgi:hypothetical protein
MVKRLPIMLGKTLARECAHNNGQGRDHSMTLSSGVADLMIKQKNKTYVSKRI